MKWIKASHRLPPYRYEQDVFYKLDGERKDGFIRSEKGKNMFSYLNGCYIDVEDLSRVEWLDETPSESEAVEVKP